MTIRGAAARLLALLQRRRLDDEFDDEIRAHLELAERDGIQRGLSAEEARRMARQSFGGVEKVKEEHRDRRSLRWIDTLLRDFRYGLASLARAPGFAAVLIGVLALGIGANVAMFSVLDAVLLKPLPFLEPGRIVRVWEAPRPGVVNATTAADFLGWKQLAPEFEALAAEHQIRMTYGDRGQPARLTGKAVTAGYFHVFGIRAQLGRTFDPGEDGPGAGRSVVLGHAAWKKYFGGDPEILHSQVILNGEAHQVIGVLPPGPFDRDECSFWTPLVFTPEQQSNNMHWLTVHGRLRGDASLSQVRERMQAIHAGLAESKPVNERQGTVEVQPLAGLLAGRSLQQSIYIAFGAVLLVLLITCANVANLLLANGATRTKEMAVRAALGAGRGRLVAQLLTESLAVCILGGAAGVAVAWLLIQAAAPLLSETLPFTAELGIDLRALTFAGAVVFGVCLISGIVPALQSSFGNLSSDLNEAARGSSGGHSRMRRAIVAGEVALSLVLVCGALLLVRSLVKLQRIDTGVRMESVITTSIDLPEGAYPSAQQAALFYQAVSERLGTAPGIERVGIATHLPLEWIGNGEAVQIAGIDELVRVRFKRVDPGYFGALGIPILAGRGILSGDREGRPRVVVINEALAAQLKDAAGIENPIGKVVRLSTPGYIEQRLFSPEVEIVGVIRSERVASPGARDPAVVYVPLAQAPAAHVKLIVRTPLEAGAAIETMRGAVRQINASLPLSDVVTLEQFHDRRLSFASRPAWLIGAFAAIATLLTAIGLYGVLSQSVAQQRRAIGIRMALGARRRAVVAHVLRGAMTVTGAGLAFGMLGALSLTRVMKSLLYEVSPLDPAALVVACVSMTLISLLASLVPANRAARVDPVETLRDEG
jgi:predicted permease